MGTFVKKNKLNNSFEWLRKERQSWSLDCGYFH